MDKFILSVEDNSDDILLFGLAFRKAKIAARVEFLTDGEKAIDSVGLPEAFVDPFVGVEYRRGS